MEYIDWAYLSAFKIKKSPNNLYLILIIGRFIDLNRKGASLMIKI